MWLILCGALVMFMHAGFAMLEAGCCRAGFTQSVSQPLSGLRYTGDPRPGVCRWFSRMFTVCFQDSGAISRSEKRVCRASVDPRAVRSSGL